jgi:YD repeat-containing protein
MKNILGTTESLELFDKDGKIVYEFYKGSDGYSYERTCDSNGKVLTFKESTGYSSEYTYDSDGRELTYKNSIGYSYEYTRDSDGRELTYKSSTGVMRGFDVPEYTMEELVEKIGNFKIKK